MEKEFLDWWQERGRFITPPNNESGSMDDALKNAVAAQKYAYEIWLSLRDIVTTPGNAG